MHACGLAGCSHPRSQVSQVNTQGVYRHAAPDVCGDTLVRVVHQGTSLQLVEGAVRKVLTQQPRSQPLTPLQRQARLSNTQGRGSGFSTNNGRVAC